MQGLRYVQTVEDTTPKSDTFGHVIHKETGFWLNVPATVAPPRRASIVRQGSIPHGTTVIMQGGGSYSKAAPVLPAYLDSQALWL